MALPIKINESVLKDVASRVKKEEESKLFELNGETVELGQRDSLRYNLLANVLEENYDQALIELNKFKRIDSPYPRFKEKIGRHMSHCLDLIYAIKAKRNFPGISSLTRPKQQELREKYLSHFRELQWTLKRIEKIETDLRLNDAKSTIYVVQAICLSAFAILLLAFVLEVYNGLAATSYVVIDDLYTRGINFIFELLGM